ncbi:MATE family efflux transporter [Rubrivirga marina]|uniref:Multidrug-efflux transporter n=1 Tax=Rubrivirga marina TaxID=1196024 RepID=A0A271IYH7_9BACT|nr:MATE family efflux transporter [Rubrivirga marina]PAP76137.1 MATE family efflux transporter [Rubrivirga marina]
MLDWFLSPIRLAVDRIGLALAAFGLVSTRRARRVSDLAWPRIVTGLARMSQSTADVAMVGTALGTAAIAGVGYATPFWLLAFMVGGGIAGGTLSLVSQRYGAGRRDAIGGAVTTSAALALAVTLPLVVAIWLLAEPLVGLIGSGAEAVAFGAEYLRVAAFGMPFAALNLVASRALVGAGDARTPMVIRAGGAVLNIGLNAWLIFGAGLGVVGAALGTVLASAAATAAFAWGLSRGRLPGVGSLPVRLGRDALCWDPTTARHLVEIAAPLALTNLVQNGGQFPLLAIVSLFGPDVAAAFVVALRIRDLMNTPGWGFGLASSSLVGQSLGTGREGEAGAYARDALRIAVAVYVLAATAVFAFAGPFSRLFVSDPAVLPTTVALVRVTCVSVVLWGVVTGAKGPLRASGDTRWPLVGHVVALVGFVLPAAYLGAVTPLGVAGLGLALLLETGVPAAVTYARFRSDRWKLVSRAYRPA